MPTPSPAQQPAIRTWCSWCGSLIHDGQLTADGKGSHGICGSCLATQLAALDAMAAAREKGGA